MDLFWFYLTILFSATLSENVKRICRCHKLYWVRIAGFSSESSKDEEIMRRHELWKTDRHLICHEYQAYQSIDYSNFVENAKRYHELLLEADRGAQYQ